jgi:hypothetical protein
MRVSQMRQYHAREAPLAVLQTRPKLNVGWTNVSGICVSFGSTWDRRNHGNLWVKGEQHSRAACLP